jgi:hypothetical protein
MRRFWAMRRENTLVATSAEKAANKAGETANSTISQLLARILAQLSLSAWLPAAALVLLTTCAFQLAAVLDDHRNLVRNAAVAHKTVPPLAPGAALTEALGRIGDTAAGGLILMFAAVVVLTMLTQAFAFESIRFLEGYWSPIPPIEWLASGLCLYFRGRLTLVRNSEFRITEKAWNEAKSDIMEEHAKSPPPDPHLTPEMIDALEVLVLRRGDVVSLSPDQEEVIASYNWREHAPATLLRRLKNLDKRKDDYPSVKNIQPTRLGNVLRHYEEESGNESVESMVDEVFDRLPFSLQISHDEQRGRLDLYCSMTFVWLFVSSIAVLRFGWGEYRAYAISSIIVGVVAAYLTYRAAVASARYYGNLLLVIAAYLEEPVTHESSWWRRPFSALAKL